MAMAILKKGIFSKDFIIGLWYGNSSNILEDSMASS